MDNFKKHIQQNKELLDAKEPAENVWLTIQQQLPQQKSIPVISIVKWAVAACIVALCGWGINYLFFNKTEQQVAVKKAIPVTQPLQKIIAPAENNQENFVLNNPSTANIPATKQSTKSTPEKTNPVIANHEAADAAMLSLESSFINIINLQKTKISSTPLYTEGPAYYNDFVVRFKQMDKDEQQVKKVIAKEGLTDELLSRLTNIYQQKLSVLKSMQTEINKTNSRYMQNRNPSDNTNNTTFIHI